MGILNIQVQVPMVNLVAPNPESLPIAKAVMAKPIMAGQLKAKAEEEDDWVIYFKIKPSTKSYMLSNKQTVGLAKEKKVNTTFNIP